MTLAAILIFSITGYAFAIRAAWRDLNSTAKLVGLSTGAPPDQQWFSS
jgi:hypothetical protein